MRAGFDRLEADARRMRQRRAPVQPHRLGAARPGRAAALRERIGALRMEPATATASFVKLVAGLLAVVFEAADGATDPEISRRLVAMFNFMQGKEFAGQERACGAARLRLGPQRVGARQQQWLHLIDSQEACFQTFTEFSSPALAEHWRASQPPPPLAELERLRRIACAAPAGAALDAELSHVWFDCCTRRIDAMQVVEERLAADLRSLCARKTAQARAELQAHERAAGGAGARGSKAAPQISSRAPTSSRRHRRRPMAGSSSARSWTWCRSSRSACRR